MEGAAEVEHAVALDQANDENVSGYDFLRALVRKMMTEQSSESTEKRPLTAAFRGVERDNAYGSYLVSSSRLLIFPNRNESMTRPIAGGISRVTTLFISVLSYLI